MWSGSTACPLLACPSMCLLLMMTMIRLLLHAAPLRCCTSPANHCHRHWSLLSPPCQSTCPPLQPLPQSLQACRRLEVCRSLLAPDSWLAAMAMDSSTRAPGRTRRRLFDAGTSHIVTVAIQAQHPRMDTTQDRTCEHTAPSLLHLSSPCRPRTCTSCRCCHCVFHVVFTMLLSIVPVHVPFIAVPIVLSVMLYAFTRVVCSVHVVVICSLTHPSVMLRSFSSLSSCSRTSQHHICAHGVCSRPSMRPILMSRLVLLVTCSARTFKSLFQCRASLKTS